MSSSDDANHDRLEAVSNAQVDEERLLTVAVPPSLSAEESLDRLRKRQESTQYLHAGTEERVGDALSALRSALDGREATGNGFVACAGVVDGEAVAHVFPDPAARIEEFGVQRDEEFATNRLESGEDGEGDAEGGSQEGRAYGLLVVEHGSVILGRLEGSDLTVLESFGSDRAEDNPMEGSLSDREQEHRDFFERVAERAGVHFLDEDPDEERRSEATPGEADADPVAGLFVGGSSVTASEFIEEEYLDHRLQNRIRADAVAVGDTTEDGLEQLAGKARDHVEAAEHERIRGLLSDLFGAVDADEEAVLGRDATDEALTYEGVETALVVESRPNDERRQLEERTVSQGGEFVTVPEDLDGADRLAEAGGVGALLRFPIE